jgi:competence protein ComEA
VKLPELFRTYVGFTRNETIAVLFLSGSLLTGLAVQRYLPKDPPVVPKFDYAESDSIYNALTHEVAPAPKNGQKPGGNQSAPHAKSAPPAKGVNINTADVTALTTLPGIGKKYAERVIEYRTAHGRFKSPDDLENVKGIGPKKMEKIRPFIRITDGK